MRYDFESNTETTTATPQDHQDYETKTTSYFGWVLKGMNPNPVESKVDDLVLPPAVEESEAPSEQILQEIREAMQSHDLPRLKIFLGPALAPVEQNYQQASAKRLQRFEQASEALRILADEILPRAQWFIRRSIFKAWWEKYATSQMKTIWGEKFVEAESAYTSRSQNPVEAIDAYKKAMIQHRDFFQFFTQQAENARTAKEARIFLDLGKLTPEITDNFHQLLRAILEHAAPKSAAPYQADSEAKEEPQRSDIAINVATANRELELLINAAAQMETAIAALYYLHKETKGKHDLCSKYIPQEQAAADRQFKQDQESISADYFRNGGQKQYKDVGNKSLDDLKFDAIRAELFSGSELTLMHLAMAEYAQAKTSHDKKIRHQIVMYLFERGASSEILDAQGRTAYEYAGLTPLDLPSEWHDAAIKSRQPLLITATDPTIQRALTEAHSTYQSINSVLGWFLYASLSPLAPLRNRFTNIPDRDRLRAATAIWFSRCGTAQLTHDHQSIQLLLQHSLVTTASSLTATPKRATSSDSHHIEMESRQRLLSSQSSSGYGT